MAAHLVQTLPEGPDWVYEIKWDGYRVEALKWDAEVRLLSRKKKNLTAEFPMVARAVAALKADRTVLDGEIVAVDASGRPSFQALQNRSAMGTSGRVMYYAFDLLCLDGDDLTALPLVERKRKLERLLRGSPVLFSANLAGEPANIVEQIRRLDLEGVIAKRRDSVYEPGNRSGAWVKVQFKRQQEFVIGGYKPDGASLSSIAAGYYEQGKLMFAGKVRGGFDPLSRAALLKVMQPLESEKCPFANLPSSKTGQWGEGMTAEQMAEMKWLKPRLVAQIKFTEWTRDGHLRHADYLGLRDDKSPREVVRELPAN